MRKLAFAAALLVTTPLRADECRRANVDGTIFVRATSNRAAWLDRQKLDGDWVHTCRLPCDVTTVPGTFRVAGAGVTTSDDFPLMDEGALRVRAGSDAAHRNGIVLTVAGSALLATSAVLFFESIRAAGTPGASPSQTTFGYASFAALLGGFITLGIGISITVDERTRVFVGPSRLASPGSATPG